MKRIGLALSGGGFRACLYHLGLVRFLRDAEILSKVTHITSVSGGSVLAAHLVMNWDRYCGSANEFDAVASELLDFVRLDVRNRITRHFPLNIPLRWPRRILGLSNRRLTRTGLLEHYYEKYLYNDRSLFELPERPQLHILSTNLSEGCLCSFHRNGLLLMRRQAGHRIRIDRIHIGLATVAMAVTASSAFPGFFPPLELTGADVGANRGEFGRQSYTDGGVFDNLGVRMFGCVERPILMDTPLSDDDFFDVNVIIDALRKAFASEDETPLRRISQLMVSATRTSETPLPEDVAPSKEYSSRPPVAKLLGEKQDCLDRLWSVLRYYQIYREPIFDSLEIEDSEAENVHKSGRANQNLDAVDQFWLNRHLFETAVRQATGKTASADLTAVSMEFSSAMWVSRSWYKTIVEPAVLSERHSERPTF